MHIKRMMNKIIEKGKQEDMEWFGDLFVDMVYEMKETNPNWYKSIEYQMHKMAYGDHLTEEAVKNIYLSNLSCGKLGKLYNVSKNTIKLIKNKKMWKWLTDKLNQPLYVGSSPTRASIRLLFKSSLFFY